MPNITKRKKFAVKSKNPPKNKGAAFLKLVEWSTEDGCFIGSAPPLIGQCCHGDDEEAVYRELCRIVDEWIAIMEKDGIPLPAATAGREYSGKFVVRTSPEIHKLAALRALRDGESLNSFVEKALRKETLLA